MGKDDCLYAFRKLYTVRNKNEPHKFNPGDMIYRCVRYKTAFVNLRKGG
jgi:hypothetical protein